MRNLWKEQLAIVGFGVAIFLFFMGFVITPVMNFFDGWSRPKHFYGPVTREEVANCIESTDMGFRFYPGDPHARVSRASIHNLMGEGKEAILCCNEALEFRPAYMYAYAERALAHSILKEKDKAAADIQTAFRLDSKDYHVYKMQGRVSAQNGDTLEAITYYSKALSMNRKDDTLFADRARAYYKIERYKESLADMEEAIKLKPVSTYHEIRGAIYMEMGHYDEALTSINAALMLEPDLKSAYARRADCIRRLSEIKNSNWN